MRFHQKKIEIKNKINNKTQMWFQHLVILIHSIYRYYFYCFQQQIIHLQSKELIFLNSFLYESFKAARKISKSLNNNNK